MDVESLVANLVIILATGLAAGIICKRLGISLLVGYLATGALIGPSALGLVGQRSHEMEGLAELGALLLLFSVGLEFSLSELWRMRGHFLRGGVIQMLAVAVPLLFICRWAGLNWNAAILASGAAALSSTVLVFKALGEWGKTNTPHGKRALAILLFQDLALVPLMLLVPLLTGEGPKPSAGAFATLAFKSAIFIAIVLSVRICMSQYVAPVIAKLRSVELVVLLALAALGGACLGAVELELPAPVGALAAGLMLGGNRLSKQIDAIILPFRESFAAVFFVTLGTLLNLRMLEQEPLVIAVGLVGMMLLKTLAATVALRATGLNWQTALGTGLGLSQLGEFSFLLIAQGSQQGLFKENQYQEMLFIALGSLFVTPQLLKWGLSYSTRHGDTIVDKDQTLIMPIPVQRSLVIGLGPIGRQVASQLEMLGIDVCAVDASPINVNSLAQMGYQAIAGDARDLDVLKRANVRPACLIVISVPEDNVARDVVRSVRELNPKAPILVRCRYQINSGKLKRSGATVVVSEEAEAAGSILRWCKELVTNRPKYETVPPDQEDSMMDEEMR